MTIKIIETAKETNNRLTPVYDGPIEQLSHKMVNQIGILSSKTRVNIEVNTKKTFQEMIGFGGAFTEAASYTLSRMSEDQRAKVLELYFNKEVGLAYNIGRVHIHSCDFALGNYTYVDEGDTMLESFTIDHEHKWTIPLIKDAMEERGEAISLLASPWSPPAWMKDTKEMNNGGKLLPEYFETWAMYYAKFIKAMRADGLEIFSITVQNEPAAVQVWDSCIYSAEDERDFVKNHLGPVLVREGLGDIKIFIWDHNRDIVVERASTVLSDPEAAKYIYGTGIHWYVSEEFDNVGKVHDLFPDKHILFTEGCQEGGVHLGSWDTGERYGRNMIGDFNNWCEGYLDWNIVLDETGGPNHVGNLCDAPIIADTKTDQLHINSSYYYIGHFSKYVMQGAKRVGLIIREGGLLGCAFVNPDSSKVIIIQNQSEEDLLSLVSLDGIPVSYEVKARSIITMLIQ